MFVAQNLLITVELRSISNVVYVFNFLVSLMNSDFKLSSTESQIYCHSHSDMCRITVTLLNTTYICKYQGRKFCTALRIHYMSTIIAGFISAEKYPFSLAP